MPDSSKNGDLTIHRVQRVAWLLAFVVGVLLVHSVVMQIQLTRGNRALDEIRQDSNHISNYVDELEAAPPIDLQPVFRAVFDSRDILCDEYPEHEVCQGT